MLKRLRNKYFVAAAVSFAALVYKTATGSELPAQFDTIVNVGLALLTTLGIVIDPTTPGMADKKESEQQ